MFTTFAIFSGVYLLNVIGIFVIEPVVMTVSYVGSAILLLLPMVLTYILKLEKRYIKYINVTGAALFVMLISITLTYHVVVIYVYPIAIAIIFTMLCTRTVALLSKLIHAVEGQAKYHNEMVMGFATLVENKDGSTGGHIKRTSLYVRLLAEELKCRGLYEGILTKDYMENLCKAAPLHDIGKIAIPDSILQKPGKLTNEEFDTMKQHAVRGGEIIRETFGNLEDKAYTQMAYEVARYHHEKWNGKGYPEGLKRKEIPLAARIMAIADVFDAVSEKRCYRDAMPLDKCFEIICEGSGQDFEPMLVEVFLDIRDKVEKVHNDVVKGVC